MTDVRPRLVAGLVSGSVLAAVPGPASQLRIAAVLPVQLAIERVNEIWNRGAP